MHIVLFDAVLEQHTLRSLARALAARGHQVTTTGPIWRGHRLPQQQRELERIGAAVEQVCALRPDAVFNFRAATLPGELVEKLRAAGALTLLWLPDDPVLYQLCYRHVVDAYDVLLHAGGRAVLEFYESRHAQRGLNFPFWTDERERPYGYNPAAAECELVFLGNCTGPVRRGRYELIGSLPFRTRIYGKVRPDPLKLCAGYLSDPAETARALGTALCGLSIPQSFAEYAGSEYDFPELAALGHFEFPSRVVQYAAVGLPVVSLQPDGPPEAFPELVTASDRDELIERAEALLADRERLVALAAATHVRFRRSFSAAARAAFLEQIVANPGRWAGLSRERRAVCFATVLPQEPATAAPAHASAARAPRPVARAIEELPSVEQQRDELRRRTLESPHKWRILCLGTCANGDTDIVAALLRALRALGHTVLHVDTLRHRYALLNPPERNTGYGPVYVDLSAIERLIERFRPQVIVCLAGGLCFRKQDAERLREQGILLLGLTLSDPDVQSSMIDHIDCFDVHTTNSLLALGGYQQAGIRNTVLLPFGIDRAYVVAEVEHDPNLEADVICLGHATNRPERKELMARLAREFRVRVYGRGWDQPGVEPVRGYRMVQASRAGRVHINFARTQAGHVNVKCGVFETIGSGAVLCTSVFDEMRRYFEYGTEIIGFESEDELITQLRELLSSRERYEALRRRAFRRLIGEHLYEQRWLDLFALVEQEVFGEPTMLPPERALALRPTLGRSQPRPRCVVISGFYGARNAGDELILRAIVDGVRQREPALRFVVAAEDPVVVERLHGYPAFRRTELSAADAQLHAASALVLGGGGLWHDYTFQRAGGNLAMFGNTGISLGGFAKLPLLARARGKPFHVFGVGAGPLTSSEARQFLRFLGGLAQSITVRDPQSQELLSSIEGWERPVEYAPDPVYALELRPRRVPGAVAELAGRCPLLAVNLRMWSGARNTRLYENVARAVELVARRNDCAVVGVPFQPGEHGDETVLRRLLARLRIPRPTLLLEWAEDFAELFGVLEASSVLLAMRLHACLLGHRLGTPTLALAYDPKVRQHFRQVGLEEFALPLDVSVAELADCLERLLRDGRRLPPRAVERLGELETAARSGLRRLADRLLAAPEAPAVAKIRFQTDGVSLGQQATGRDAEFEDERIDLWRGRVSGGSLSDSAAEVPISLRRRPSGWLFHMARGAPRRGEFAAYSLPLAHEPGRGQTLLLDVRSPYMRPRNKGRLLYQVLLDDQVLLEEDVALWDETNHIRVLFRPQSESSLLAVRVVAQRDCEEWNWGHAGRLIIRGISQRPCAHSGPPRVWATSPFSIIPPQYAPTPRPAARNSP